MTRTISPTKPIDDSPSMFCSDGFAAIERMPPTLAMPASPSS
jgi:hypothetical protein